MLLFLLWILIQLHQLSFLGNFFLTLEWFYVYSEVEKIVEKMPIYPILIFPYC